MSETFHITAEESTTATVVEAVAEETGREPHELPTLYQTVDPDALTQLVDGSRADRAPNVTVTFDMAGCTVRVTDTGEVTVERIETPDARPSGAAEVPNRESGAIDPSGDSGAPESPASEFALGGSR